jgi:adenine-specific DNA-methyltransferase
MARQNYRDLTHEQLVALLEARDRKKFGLVWERDAIEHDRTLNEDFVVLDAVPEFHAGAGPHENLIIEGDNFDALRALRVAYAGKVKCIYIDPPYNTGNRDFVYNDRFVEKDHNWRHSMWLEFMYQRLTLAKELLAQDGAIFVSIDDNEIFHLGLLMNEVFGEGNFVANVIWQKRTSPDARLRLGAGHEYMLGYAASKDHLDLNKAPLSEKDRASYSNPDDDRRGPWSSADFTAQGFRPNQMYEIITPTGRKLAPPRGRCWAKIESEFDKLRIDSRVWFGPDGAARPRVKNFLSETVGRSSWTWWSNSEVGHSQEAKKELLTVMSETEDSPLAHTPKPVRLIERILQIATNPGDLILDFFAGSGTTAHAVLKMNAANPDQPPRKFILVSNTESTTDEPDKNLCRDVCRQRVANVISGYGQTPGTGGSFAYLRTRRIPMNRVVRKIDHPQVWLFLQLMHFGGLEAEAPLASGRLFVRRGDKEVIFYLTTLTEAILQRMEKELAGLSHATLYTWQPEALASRYASETVSILPIPQTLIERFGPRS